MSAAPARELDELIGRRVLFGHQSVGENILDGVRDLLREAGREWPIVDLGQPAPGGGALIHARVGRNEEPLTKCEDFRRLVDEGAAGPIDVAVLKFCYIDVGPRTDVTALCERYRCTLEDLARRHSETVFVATTVPLGVVKGGPVVWVREALGRPNQAKLKNAARHAFNEQLRRGWTSSPLFDLAAAESKRPDGRRATFTYRGTTSEHLVGAYTDDGGHLNATGRRPVAAAFVRTLAAALRSRA